MKELSAVITDEQQCIVVLDDNQAFPVKDGLLEGDEGLLEYPGESGVTDIDLVSIPNPVMTKSIEDWLKSH